MKVREVRNLSKFVALLIIVTIVFVPLLSLSNKSLAASGDEVRAGKKIVSVVFDDSGSMYGDRWSYVDYAMQSLIALMNEQDTLIITFMGEPDVYKQVNLSAVQTSVDYFKKLDCTAGTPSLALYTAREGLDVFDETDPTTQFWYIVMTDGAIYDNSTGIDVDTQGILDDYKDDVMSNGTSLNVVYMGMGKGAVKINGDASNNMFSYAVADDDDIVDAVLDMSNLISGRLPADSIKQIDSKTIEVRCDLPFYSMSVLSQKSSAVVVSAKSSEDSLNIQRNISMDATNIPGGERIDSLYGTASVANKIGPSGELVAAHADTYVVTFSDDVDVSTMSFLYEPAITLATEISRNGVVISDMSELQDQDKVTVKLIPVVPGTGNPIDESSLPANISWKIEYIVDDNVVDSANGRELSGVELTWGDNIIRGTMTIPGFVPLVQDISFSLDNLLPTPTPTPTPTPIVHEYGIDQKQTDENEFNRREITKGDVKFDEDNTYLYVLTDSDVPLSVEDQEEYGVSIVIDSVEITPNDDREWYEFLGFRKMNFDLVLNSDGTYTLMPKAPAFNWFSIFVKTGTYKVTVVVSDDESVTATSLIHIVPDGNDPYDIPFIIAGLLILADIIQIIFFRKKFKGDQVKIQKWGVNEDGSGTQKPAHYYKLGRLSLSMLIPFYPRCFKKIDGLMFYAEDGGQVIISGDTIAKTCAGYSRSLANPQTSAASILNGMAATSKPDPNRKNRRIRSAPDQAVNNTPLYTKASQNANTIRSIKLH